MLVFVLALALAGSKLEFEEDPLEVRVPKISDKDDAAILDALAGIQKPASDAALHEAVQTCALLAVDVAKPLAAAKSGTVDGLDKRCLAIADGYLGLGDWVNAEKALRAVSKQDAFVLERLGRALRGQNRFADSAKAFETACKSESGAELDELVRRVWPVAKDWVVDYEAGRAKVMHDAAKTVLAAIHPHQAGDESEATKKLLDRLDPPGGKVARQPLTPSRVQNAVAVQVPALRGCYARALAHEPELKGKLTVSVSVDDSGKVTLAKAGTNTTGSTRLAQCIEGRMKALNLPTDSSADMSYPFALNPL